MSKKSSDEKEAKVTPDTKSEDTKKTAELVAGIRRMVSGETPKGKQEDEDSGE